MTEAAARLASPHDHVFLSDNHERNERHTWIVIEITAGTIFGSMALVADGWHMSTHAGAMLIAALACPAGAALPEGVSWRSGPSGRLARAAPVPLSSGRPFDLDGDVGQVVNMRKPAAVEGGFPRVGRAQRDDGTVMPRPEPPDVKVGDPHAVALDRLADLVGQVLVRRDVVQQHRARIADQPPGPAGDHEAPTMPMAGSIHVQP